MPDDVPYKRQRVSKACDSCRRKKVKVFYLISKLSLLKLIFLLIYFINFIYII